MTVQPRLRVVNKSNTHTFMMTIPSDYTNREYSLTVPSEPFRKDFSDNEVWTQMKIFSDMYHCSISCTALCLDAEYNVLAEYLQNTEYDGTVPFECDLGNGKSFILMQEQSTRFGVVSPDTLPTGNFIKVKLLNGGDFPLPNQKVFAIVHKNNSVYKAFSIQSDSKGVCTLPEALPHGKYSIWYWYGGATIDGMPYSYCDLTHTFKMEGLHDTSLQIAESYYTCQDVFRMIKDKNGDYVKSPQQRRVLYITGSSLLVYLKDKDETTKISGERVTLKVGDNTYTSTTNDSGIASFNIYLNDGEYPVTIRYKGSDYYNSCKCNINYTLRVKKNKSCQMICANRGSSKQNVSKKGNFSVNLYETNNTVFQNANYYPDGNDVWKTPAPHTNPNDKYTTEELLNTLLRQNIPKEYNAPIGTDSNHIRNVEFLKSTSQNGTYSKIVTQRLKGYVRNTIDVNDTTTQYYIKTIFEGDKYFNSKTRIFTVVYSPSGSNKSATHIVTPVTVNVNSSKHLKFRLKTDNYEYLTGKRLSFSVDGKSYSAKIDNEGYATFPKSLKVGSYKMTIKFTGDDFFKSASKSFEFNVLSEKSNAIADRLVKGLSSFNGHLVIPEEINEHTEYLQFIYKITVPYNSSTMHIFFNNFMLNAGNVQIDYQEAVSESTMVNFVKNYYTLLYSNRKDELGVEVIRPSKDNFNTTGLTRCEHSIISPFNSPTIKEDKPKGICKEYLNFHHQTINISQDNE